MCSSPCGCCEPVFSFDTNFNEAVPWKCFFQDVQDTYPVDSVELNRLSNGLDKFNAGLSCISDYRNPGARPINKMCANSYYATELFKFPGGVNNVVRSIMARMKFDQPDPDIWQPQKITISVKYKMQSLGVLPSFVEDLSFQIVLGDEHDDLSQNYASTLQAYPRLLLRAHREVNHASFLDCGTYDAEGMSNSGSFSGYNLFANRPPIDYPIPDEGTMEFIVEARQSSTRFHLSINGKPYALGNTADPATYAEYFENSVSLFRPSPHWRFVLNATQFNPANTRHSVMFDRIAVKSELLSP